MQSIQLILVLIVFGFALGYLIQKFIWKPSFLKGKKASKNCGDDNCGCH